MQAFRVDRGMLRRLSIIMVIVFVCGTGWVRASLVSNRHTWLYEEGGVYTNVGTIAVAEFKNGGASFAVPIPEFCYQNEMAGMDSFETLPSRAYALDFMLDPSAHLTRVMPTHDISFTFDQLSSLRGMESLTAQEVNRVRWILHHSMPFLETPEQCAMAFNIPGLSKNDVIVATQLAIWSIVTQMFVTEIPRDYEERTIYVELYFDALMRNTRPAKEYEVEPIGDVSYAGIKINAPIKHIAKPGVMGNYTVGSAKIGGEKVNVWLEKLPYPLEGIESTVKGVLMESKRTNSILLTGNEASEGKSRVVSVKQMEPFALDTKSSGVMSGAVRLYAQLPYKLAYQGELVVYGIVNDEGKSLVPTAESVRWQQASLVTAGLFVGKPTQWVQLSWGKRALRALPPETLKDMVIPKDVQPDVEEFDLVENLDAMKGLTTVEDGALLDVGNPAVDVQNNVILSVERVYMVRRQQENAIERFIKWLWK